MQKLSVLDASKKPEENQTKLCADIDERLTAANPLPTAFPFCTDMMLSTYNWAGGGDRLLDKTFNDYFDRVPASSASKFPLETNWMRDLTNWQAQINKKAYPYDRLPELLSLLRWGDSAWPPEACLPRYSFRLDGARRTSPDGKSGSLKIKRLFIADLVWLYYIDKLGILKVIANLVQDYESGGLYSIPANDDINPVLEAMVRSRRMGLVSSPEDRESTYIRCLGWPQNSPLGSKSNSAFANAFFSFMGCALAFLNERRAQSVFKTAELRISPRDVLDAIKRLWQTFSPFQQGRCYNNTLSGIVSAVGGFGTLNYLRNKIGFPSDLDILEKYFPHAYDKFVLRTEKDTTSTTDFTNYWDCSEHARFLLLDVQVLGDPDCGADIEHIAAWLSNNKVESAIQGLEGAHRNVGKSFAAQP